MPLYSSYATEELIKEIRLGNNKAFFELSKRFDGVISRLSNVADVSVTEKEDLYQEGLLGLYRACLTYEESRNASFKTYATLCIKHSIYSTIRVYFSNKNNPVRTGSPIDDASAMQCPDLYTDPERLLLEKEGLRLIKESIDTLLSDYERDILKLFLQGLSYEVIANKLSTSPKSVDNAIQRIRGKLKKFVKCNFDT